MIVIRPPLIAPDGMMAGSLGEITDLYEAYRSLTGNPLTGQTFCPQKRPVTGVFEFILPIDLGEKIKNEKHIITYM